MLTTCNTILELPEIQASGRQLLKDTTRQNTKVGGPLYATNIEQYVDCNLSRYDTFMNGEKWKECSHCQDIAQRKRRELATSTVRVGSEDYRLQDWRMCLYQAVLHAPVLACLDKVEYAGHCPNGFCGADTRVSHCLMKQGPVLVRVQDKMSLSIGVVTKGRCCLCKKP